MYASTYTFTTGGGPISTEKFEDSLGRFLPQTSRVRANGLLTCWPGKGDLAWHLAGAAVGGWGRAICWRRRVAAGYSEGWADCGQPHGIGLLTYWRSGRTMGCPALGVARVLRQRSHLGLLARFVRDFQEQTANQQRCGWRSKPWAQGGAQRVFGIIVQ